MALTSLVVCADRNAVQVLGQILQELTIGVEHCADLSAAASRLAAQHFDAVVVDCKYQSAAIEFIATVRKLPRQLAGCTRPDGARKTDKAASLAA